MNITTTWASARVGDIARGGRRPAVFFLALWLAPLIAVFAISAADASASSAAVARESDAADLARSLLPGQFQSYQTRRYLVFSDADPAWTREQIDTLERTHHQFQRLLKRLDLQAQPLRHKLVCILFRDRADYQAFAVKNDKVSDPWIGGYYSPAHDWIVFYQADSNPSVETAREQLDQMKSQLDELSSRISKAEREGDHTDAVRLRKAREERNDHLKRELGRVEEFTQRVSTATTTHEATHQLLFHSGVQSPGVQYPLWICEGLATSFETDNPRNAFGPDHEYQPRRETFQTLLRHGKLMPLRELAAMREFPAVSLEAVQVVYHQSYALTTWLSRHRKAELKAYLAAMLALEGKAADPAALLKAFETSFGDINQLEAAWLKHERSQLPKTETADSRR